MVLLLLQQQLTQAYVAKGYFTSFVIFEYQDSNGTVIFKALEGSGKLDIEATGLRDRYVERQLHRFVSTPLNLDRLQEGLTLLRTNPLIKDLNATVNPGDNITEKVIGVNAIANPAWEIGVEGSNDENPIVGAWGVRGFIYNNNVAGGGEQFRTEYKVTEGLNRWLVGVTMPISLTNSKVELTYQQSDSRIIDGFFEDFDIRNHNSVVSVSFSQPIWQKINETLDFSVGVDHRESQSFILKDELFTDIRLLAIRLNQTYINRSPNTLIIGLSQFSIGSSNQNIDATFFHWQGQAQVLWNFGIGELYSRLALQLSPHTLPNIEQCAIGGRNGNEFVFGNMVRGYTTNIRTGDNCLALTLEVRFPVYRSQLLQLSVFPFVDVGTVWNNSGGSLSPQTLIGTGIGGRLTVGEYLFVQTNYGFPLTDSENPFEGQFKQAFSVLIQGKIRF